jgi:ABC-2 type transport system permease protein
MIKYETIAIDPDATSALIGQMPASIKTVFGMNGLNIATLDEYFGVCFLFIAIMLAVHAALLGSGLLTVEPLNKTTEFLYTKPASRRRIVTAKLLSGLIHIGIVWAVTYVAAWGSITLYDTMTGFEQTLALFMAAAAVIQITFLSLGLAVAAGARLAGNASKTMSGLVFASYAIFLISQLDGYAWSRAFSIFRHFDAVDILANGALSVTSIVVCLVISAMAIVFAYLYYPRRDLTSL